MDSNPVLIGTLLYRDEENYSRLFEISRLSADSQCPCPCTANFGKFKLNSRNLAGIILHDSEHGISSNQRTIDFRSTEIVFHGRRRGCVRVRKLDRGL